MRLLSLNRAFALSILLGVYVYIFAVALSYDNAWVQPEVLYIKGQVLKKGPSFSIKDIAKAFDTVAFESTGRSTRPIASLFEILDTKSRAFLWRFFPPHPGLSLILVVSLLLTPFFLFRWLRLLGVSSALTYITIAFYLVSPGALSLVSMLFRPAKALANFSIILILYWATQLGRKKSINSRDFRRLVGGMIFCFFCDETALLLYPALPFFFPSFFNRKRILYYALIPLFMFLSYLVFLPLITASLGFGTPHLSQFGALLSLKFLLSWEFLVSLWLNTKLLVVENLGLFRPSQSSSALGFGLLLANYLCVLAWLFILVLNVRRTLFGKVSKGPEPVLFRRVGLFLLALTVGHSVLMGSITAHVWGPYWYGSYWAIFLALLLALSGKTLKNEWFYLVPITIVIGTLMYVFPFTNYAYKHFHYYPCTPLAIREVFLGKINRFTLKREPTFELRELTRKYWLMKRSQIPSAPLNLPKELLYIPTELRVEHFNPFSALETVVRDTKSPLFQAP